MSDTLALSIEILFEGVGASIVDTERGVVVDTTFVETPPSLWEAPLKLQSPDVLENALRQALARLPGRLPRRAHATVRPAFLARKLETSGPSVEDDVPPDPLESKAKIAEAISQELDDLAAALFKVGPSSYHYGIDSAVVYSLAKVLFDRNIELANIVPYEIASLRWGFPEGFADAVWLIVVGDTAYTLGGNSQGVYISSRRLPPRMDDYLVTLSEAIQSAIENIKPAHTYGMEPYQPTLYLSAPNPESLISELSRRLDHTIQAKPNLPAVGATREEPYTGNLLPPELAPRRYSPGWQLATGWVAVALAAVLFLSASVNLKITKTEAQLQETAQQFEQLKPYLEAQKRYRQEIARIRNLLEVYQRAEREERHWSQIVPSLVNHLPRSGGRFLPTLSGLDFQRAGSNVTASLSGTVPSEKALLALLKTLNAPPLQLTFRSSKRTPTGELDFALVTQFPSELPTVPLASPEVNRAD